MRKRFTRAIYAVSAAALVSTSLSLGAGAASAATTSHNGSVACGSDCLNLFSLRLGPNVTGNAYVPGDTGAGGNVGTKVNLHLAGNWRPNGDWQVTASGPVSLFCSYQYWALTSYVCRNYSSDMVYEVQFTPLGQPFSTLCAGLHYPVYSGENVTLQPCGSRSSTLWIADEENQYPAGPGPRVSNPPSPNCTDSANVSSLGGGPGPGPGGIEYCPWLNGASHDWFSHPLALTVDTGTQRPTNQLKVTYLNLLPGNTPLGKQLFAFYYGPVNS